MIIIIAIVMTILIISVNTYKNRYEINIKWVDIKNSYSKYKGSLTNGNSQIILAIYQNEAATYFYSYIQLYNSKSQGIMEIHCINNT